tara:strand:- start:1224 stop:2009 length:786 start_codon:yes stop_codon:yes gene_type:complete
MSKTLVTILNHNLPVDTDELYDALNSFKSDSHDIFVIDNGCNEEGKSKNVTHTLDQNVYFGGGLNVMFQYMIDNEEYDSLLFLNNDLILHPYNFVNSLREELIENDYTIVSPSIFQAPGIVADDNVHNIFPTRDQGWWFTMHNWNSKEIRQVKWVDFNAPMIHRRLIEHIRQFDPLLIYGWGIDILCGMVCEDMGWKVGVCDWIPILHLVQKTTREGKSDISQSDYQKIANDNMFEYFQKNNLFKKHMEYISHSQKYRNFK